MIGVPPICQSAAGNGGESNGDGGIRRCGGDASGAGASYAGVRKSSANAFHKRCPNQLSSARAFRTAVYKKIAQAHREPARHARPTLLIFN
jgi:hypothetical protein